MFSIFFFSVTLLCSSRIMTISWHRHIAGMRKPLHVMSLYESSADHLTTNFTHTALPWGRRILPILRDKENPQLEFLIIKLLLICGNLFEGASDSQEI